MSDELERIPCGATPDGVHRVRLITDISDDTIGTHCTECGSDQYTDRNDLTPMQEHAYFVATVAANLRSMATRGATPAELENAAQAVESVAWPARNKPISRTYRVGAPARRGIYQQWGDEPSDADPWVGLVDDRMDAARVVHALNMTGYANDEVVISCNQRIEDLRKEWERQFEALERRAKRAEAKAQATS